MIGNIYPETAWELARQGCFTSSEIFRLLSPGKRPMTESELLARPKSGVGSKTTTIEDYSILSDGAKTYILETVAELLTGTVRQFSSPATDWGNDMEPKAIEALRKTYADLEYFGNDNKKFFKYTKFSGGSPDGIQLNTVFEIKCPENPANHIANLLIKSASELKELHEDYYYQLQMNMLCTAKENGGEFEEMLGVFASYCPIMIDPKNHLHQIAVFPDFDFFSKIDKVIEAAEMELFRIINLLISDETKTDLPEQKFIGQEKELSSDNGEPEIDYPAKIEQGKKLAQKVKL